MGALVYLDTETTGLDHDRHTVWEIAYAVEDGPILSSLVRHSLANAHPKSLTLNGYERRNPSCYGAGYDSLRGTAFEADLIDALNGATLVASNPAFDAGFLRARWGVTPWHYRTLDIAAYAMGALGYDRPQGLATVAEDLRARGYDIPAPDHSAAADVYALRECHRALRSIYGTTR